MKTYTLRPWLTALAAAVMLAASGASAQDIQTFAKGSLIIPEQGNFQNGCGAVSAYGLVWQLLYQNRMPDPSIGDYDGGVWAMNPVTIYWIINTAKLSPNRCMPTNLHTPPTDNPNGFSQAKLNQLWNDGCDFSITNYAQRPVVPVNYDAGTASLVGGIYPDIPITSYSTSNTYVHPAYRIGNATQQLGGGPTAADMSSPTDAGTGFYKVQYMGGAFVIAASDTNRVIEYMRANLQTYTDQSTIAKCDGNLYSAKVASTNHYVRMHQATIAFQAPVLKRINMTPPRIAVLEAGNGVKGDMLPVYLESAGLNFKTAAVGGVIPPGSAGGCPIGHRPCGYGNAPPGLIYDYFAAFDDLKTTGTYGDGLLNQTLTQTDGGSTTIPAYKVFWTPHWEANLTPSADAGILDTIFTICDTGALAAKNACLNSTNFVTKSKTNPSKTTICNAVYNETYAECLAWQQADGGFLNALVPDGGNIKDIADLDGGANGALTPFKTGYYNPAPQYTTSPTTADKNAITLATLSALNYAVTNAVTIPPPSDRDSSLANVATFLSKTNNGMFAECAAVETYEGSYDDAQNLVIPSYNKATHFMFGQYVDEMPGGTPPLSTGAHITINGLAGSGGWDGRNCTDPDYKANNSTQSTCTQIRNAATSACQNNTSFTMTNNSTISKTQVCTDVSNNVYDTCINTGGGTVPQLQLAAEQAFMTISTLSLPPTLTDTMVTNNPSWLLDAGINDVQYQPIQCSKQTGSCTCDSLAACNGQTPVGPSNDCFFRSGGYWQLMTTTYEGTLTTAELDACVAYANTHDLYNNLSCPPSGTATNADGSAANANGYECRYRAADGSTNSTATTNFSRYDGINANRRCWFRWVAQTWGVDIDPPNSTGVYSYIDPSAKSITCSSLSGTKCLQTALTNAAAGTVANRGCTTYACVQSCEAALSTYMASGSVCGGSGNDLDWASSGLYRCNKSDDYKIASNYRYQGYLPGSGAGGQVAQCSCNCTNSSGTFTCTGNSASNSCDIAAGGGLGCRQATCISACGAINACSKYYGGGGGGGSTVCGYMRPTAADIKVITDAIAAQFQQNANSSSTPTQCALYPNPGDPFSQMADYVFSNTSGHMSEWWPNQFAGNTAVTLTGTKRLAYSWEDWTSTADTSTYGGNKGWNFFTMRQKDNDPLQGTVLYLGGHQYEDMVSGTRIVLNTLMNLGSNPTLIDRTIAAPVAYFDPNQALNTNHGALLFVSTYKAISGTVLPGVEVLDFLTAQRWKFPYYRGDLRAHNILSLSGTGTNELYDAINFDAQTVFPAPGSRNLFSYIGGSVHAFPGSASDYTITSVAGLVPTVTNNSMSANTLPHNLAQLGWRPMRIDGANILTPMVSPQTNCTDVIGYGASKLGGVDVFGFKSGGDGYCDLQQMMQYTPLTPDLSGATSAWALSNADKTNLANDVVKTQQIISMVRGFCFPKATVTAPFEPSATSQCFATEQGNTSEVGSLVRSSAAVVGASPRVPPRAVGKDRPTVAYVGGYDGQLHAFYVSGGANYEGPLSALHFLNPPADAASDSAGHGTFRVDWMTNFKTGATPVAGTELWSFMPTSQMPFLRSNGARLDASPVVQDVFVDLTGQGYREWHTILMVTPGATGREIFALDVTNPLKPVMLWDVVGSNYQVGSFPTVPSTLEVADNDTLGGGSSADSYKFNANSSTWLLPPDTTDPGRSGEGTYNYSALGGARGLTLGQIRTGLQPVYALYTASNSSGAYGAPSMGSQLFAIDVATGQKLWHVERQYVDPARFRDNAVPPTTTLRYSQDGVSKVYLPDFEGKVWELDALSGVNVNYDRDTAGCGTGCNMVAADTMSTVANPQPITTNVAMAMVPSDQNVAGDFAKYRGQTVLFFGTSGYGTIGPSISGKLHALLPAAQYRLPVTAPDNATYTMENNTALPTKIQVVNTARDAGVLQEPANWPKSFTGAQRFYGTITVGGRVVFVPLADGQIDLDDIMHLNPDMLGATLQIDLVDGGSPVAMGGPFDKGNVGAVAVYHDEPTPGGVSKDIVITTSPNAIKNLSVSNAAGAKSQYTPQTNYSTNNRGVFYRFMNWMKRFLSY